MLLMAIDKGWYGRLANNVEASANQRKILLGEVDDTRRSRDAAIEPRLDGMAVQDPTSIGCGAISARMSSRRASPRLCFPVGADY